ncbi:uncharacterized protein LOC123913428 isoform X2 [Trifolium pratense]|uniref:uncharacterized protein LOC123913428 isoform X2 n=1 Tax=Trifolium pratense TaxID=57577 RepID=UPI001E697889|nr:uncharacterized protein LOC123913428 isoform X2 [Trifolium pratense]
MKQTPLCWMFGGLFNHHKQHSISSVCYDICEKCTFCGSKVFMAEVIIRGFLLVLDWFLAYTHGYRVSRIVARSEKHNMYMLLDVNTEIYPLNIGERFLLALSPSLVLNTKDMNSNNVCSRVDCWAGTRPIPPPRLYKPRIITYEDREVNFWS